MHNILQASENELKAELQTDFRQFTGLIQGFGSHPHILFIFFPIWFEIKPKC